MDSKIISTSEQFVIHMIKKINASFQVVCICKSFCFTLSNISHAELVVFWPGVIYIVGS